MEYDSNPKIAVRREEVRRCKKCNENGRMPSSKEKCLYCKGQKAYVALVEYWVRVRYVYSELKVEDRLEEKDGQIVQRKYQHEMDNE